MHIAIVGAGFCGLAAACYLSLNKDFKITLFDPEEIGNATSGLAAGLLHPFSGAHAKRSWRFDEAISSAQELFKIAEKALNRPIVNTPGILRLALTSDQKADFSLCAKKYPKEVRWFTESECQNAVKGLLPFPGIFIDDGMVIDSKGYLEGLWKEVSKRGAQLVKKAVKSLDELSEFDAIIVAMGASTCSLKELDHLPVKQIKGHILEFAWPDGLPPLPFPVNSQAYLLMNPNSNTCLAGATFEREFSSPAIDQEMAINEILPKINAFFPGLNREHLINCRAGIRASTPGHKPLLTKYGEKCWILTGMGSKGLLYHALYAKELSNSIRVVN